MNLRLKPELQTFIEEEVKAGHFTSPEAAVEAALEQMRLDQQQVHLTPEDIEAIAESDEQIDRGEYVDFNTFAADMRRKYPGR